ncbi:MAG TPA: hypothetical protein VNC84_05615 [Gammaproteobacteria bacterium]|jgi:hypothetical protein|nr:hypothetical protein [Gammaproteobacteria bacterium]
MDLRPIKKSALFLLTAASLTVIGTNTLYADDASAGVLKQIEINTRNTLKQLDLVPTVLSQLGTFILAWTQKDESKSTASIQGDMTKLGMLIVDTNHQSAAQQSRLNNDLFNGKGNTALNANDLTYSTLLGNPFLPKPKMKDTDSRYNYIKNASGINTAHPIPGNWGGSIEDRDSYQHYFDTVSAVESYNGYVLSQLYADGNQLNELQMSLVLKASSGSDWFAEVASENIGTVLRQILLFESQVFVIMTQMLQTEKQIAATSAMTNAVLIASQQTNEKTLIAKAQGVPPRQ